MLALALMKTLVKKALFNGKLSLTENSHIQKMSIF